MNAEQMFYTKRLDKERQRLLAAIGAVKELTGLIRERKKLIALHAKERAPTDKAPLFSGSRGSAVRRATLRRVGVAARARARARAHARARATLST